MDKRSMQLKFPFCPLVAGPGPGPGTASAGHRDAALIQLPMIILQPRIRRRRRRPGSASGPGPARASRAGTKFRVTLGAATTAHCHGSSLAGRLGRGMMIGLGVLMKT